MVVQYPVTVIIQTGVRPFKYTDERHAVWAGDDDVWFQGTFDNGYANDQIHVEKIDPVNKQVKLSNPHMYGVRSGQAYQHYVALNILDELDMPGEYYLDRKTGTLYFWPPSDLQKGTIMISVMEEPMVCLEGVSHIVFRDFTMEYGRGIGLYMERGAEQSDRWMYHPGFWNNRDMHGTRSPANFPGSNSR